jgi:transmembrane sensor
MKTSDVPIADTVRDQAAEWLVECQAGTLNAEQRGQFDAWLRASPQHVRAYLELLPMWESSAHLHSANPPDARALMDWARSAAPNVVTLDARAGRAVPARPPPHATRTSEFRRSPRAFGAIAAALVLTLFAGWWALLHNVYATHVGEQRTITLADGSVVELNARSRIKVRLTSTERNLQLIEGQALFRVAPDATRPFTVFSGDTRIRAVGTQFDVYKRPGGTTITVIEGRVAVSPNTAEPIVEHRGTTLSNGETAPLSTTHGSAELLLTAGQQVSVSPSRNARPVAIDATRATAWTQRRLIFSATPLTEVAEEFNRYNTRRLVLETPDLATLRINGVFSSTDPATLVAFLREQPGIIVTESEREIRITHR